MTGWAGADLYSRTITILVVLFCLATPWSIAAAQISVVSLALVLVVAAAAGRLPKAPLPWMLIGVLFFLTAQAISIPLGVHPERSLRCFRGSWVLLFPFVFWFALADPAVRRRAIVALGITGALAGAYGIVQYVIGIDYLHHRVLESYGDGRFVAVGNLNSHLTYAGVVLPLFFLGLGSTVAAPGPRTRVTWGTATLLLLLGIVFSFTRSAWIGLAGGTVLFGLLWKRRLAALTLGGLGALGAIALLGRGVLAERLVSIFDTSDPRWRLWETALRIWRDHPVAGAGLGSFKTLFPAYKVPGEYFSTVHPHSDFLNHSVEAGLLGALAWIGIWAFFFYETRGACGARAQALRAAMGAMLLAGLSQCYSTDEEVAQLWWMLSVLAIYECVPAGRRPSPFRHFSKRFKAATLPLIARLLAPRSVLRPGDRSRVDARAIRRVLVVRQDNRLGNLLLMSPFLQALRAALPDAEIGMVIGESYADLLRDWPWVDRWFVQPKRLHARRPWLFLPWMKRLRASQWDVAFEMSNHNTHSYFNCVLTLASKAPVRIGFDEPRNQGALTHSVPAPPATLPFAWAPLTLLRPLGLQPDRNPGVVCPCPAAEEPLHPWLKRLGDDYAVVHLGGRGEKAWPMPAWTRLLTELRRRRHHEIVLVAGPDERDLVSGELADGKRVHWAPPLPIRDLARLFERAAGYLGCDSGPMHLAAAVGAPVVALFFRSNPYHYAPLGPGNTVVLLADPYGVEDARWNELPDRAQLVRAESAPAESRAGRPRSDDEAVLRIAQAVDSTWRSTGAGPDSTERPRVLQDPRERV